MIIEINLLGKKPGIKRSGLSFSGFSKEKLIIAGSLAAGLLVAAHLFLFFSFASKSRQRAELNKQWQGLSSQRGLLEELKKDYGPQAQALKQAGKIDAGVGKWALRLNRMSMDLPYGVWFNFLSFDSGSFILKGSAVSLEKEELSLINKFMDNLKDDKALSRDFSNLTLGAVQRRTLGGYDIVDFTLSASQRK